MALTLLLLGIGGHDGWGMDIQLETFAHYVQKFKFCNRRVTAARSKSLRWRLPEHQRVCLCAPLVLCASRDINKASNGLLMGTWPCTGTFWRVQFKELSGRQARCSGSLLRVSCNGVGRARGTAEPPPETHVASPWQGHVAAANPWLAPVFFHQICGF